MFTRLMIATALLGAVMVGGCSSVSVDRTTQGELHVKYTAVLTKIQAPSLSVSRQDENAYGVSFNAESIDRKSDIESMRDMFEMYITRQAPQPDGD